MEEKTWAYSFRLREAAKVLGFDPSQMKWTDFDMDVLLKVDISHGEDETPSGRSDILSNTSFAVRSIAEAFATTMNRTAAAIAEAGHLDSKASGTFLPWFPGLDRRIKVQESLDFLVPVDGFDVEKPLAGQRVDDLELIIGVVRLEPNVIFVNEFEVKYPQFLKSDDPRFGTPIVIMGITSLGFDEGSLYHWLKVRASVLALAVTLLSSPVGKGIDGGVNAYALHTEIQQALQYHAPAVEFGGFRFSGAELDKLGIQAFDYDEPGITKTERHHRIANCQVAYRILFHTNIVIDGEVGPEVMAHQKQLAVLKNVPNNSRNPFLLAELLKALDPPFKTW